MKGKKVPADVSRDRQHISEFYGRIGRLETDFATLRTELHGIGDDVRQLLTHQHEGSRTQWAPVAIGTTVLLSFMGFIASVYQGDLRGMEETITERVARNDRRIESLDTRSDKREHVTEEMDRVRDYFAALERRVDEGERESSYQEGYLAGLKDAGTVGGS